jgi:hypothetical protein
MSQTHAIQRNAAFKTEPAPARKTEPVADKTKAARQRRVDALEIDSDDIMRQARAMRSEWRRNRYARLIHG